MASSMLHEEPKHNDESTQSSPIDESEMEEINLDEPENTTHPTGEKSQLLTESPKASQHLRLDNLAPHNYHDYSMNPDVNVYNYKLSSSGERDQPETKSPPTSPLSPSASNVGGLRAIRSVDPWTPDTAQRSKLPVQTQIKQITVLQLEKMEQFGIFKNTGGILDMPSGRI